MTDGGSDISTEANALRRLARAANLSFAELANQIGVAPSTVSDWNARRKSVGTAKILPLAKLLGVGAEIIILATEKVRHGEACSGGGEESGNGTAGAGRRIA